MNIRLAYGKTGIDMDVPDRNLKQVLRIRDIPGIPDPVAALDARLRNPIGAPSLWELAEGKRNAVVVISDVTRPVPNKVLLPSILRTLRDAGIPEECVTILVATGLHRPNLGDELAGMVGEEFVAAFRIVNHDARDGKSVRRIGTTSTGTPVFINAIYLDADLKITTGYIEPHIFAGFSGGRKLICPGIAGEETIKRNHSPRFIEHPLACEGSLKGNPLHEELLEIAAMAGCDLAVDVTLNEQREITGIFAGDIFRAHDAGVAFVRDCVGSRVEAPADIVVTTSAGYPLDTSFYQSIKGLTAALPAVKTGGTIILAASCSEGLGDGSFTELVREYYDMDRFMNDILTSDRVSINQWQYEELAKVLKKADVLIYAEGIPEEDRSRLPVSVKESVAECLDAAFTRHGCHASVVVIPNGPYVLPESGTRSGVSS